MIWYNAQQFSETYALRPYSLEEMLRGCKVLSSRDSELLHLQQNHTSLTSLYRQAATALSDWGLIRVGAADAGYQGEVGGFYNPLGCTGRSRVPLAEDGSHAVS